MVFLLESEMVLVVSWISLFLMSVMRNSLMLILIMITNLLIWIFMKFLFEDLIFFSLILGLMYLGGLMLFFSYSMMLMNIRAPTVKAKYTYLLVFIGFFFWLMFGFHLSGLSKMCFHSSDFYVSGFVFFFFIFLVLFFFLVVCIDTSIEKFNCGISMYNSYYCL